MVFVPKFDKCLAIFIPTFDEFFAVDGPFGKNVLANPLSGGGSGAGGTKPLEIIAIKKFVNPRNVGMLNKSEGRGGGLLLGKLEGGRGGDERGKKLLLLSPSPLLKNSFLSRSLFSLDRIPKYLMPGAFYASKCCTSLKVLSDFHLL